ncbi:MULTISPECIES: sensor histidine kinase [unclassified Streptomyces]|uniref:sensor histidine kinase n=1 Tax=unclassified Streptomyces TaxID=2593676 RepID=UPI0004BF978E|nr:MULTISPECIES: ATP-binding protein [unclassified Streptomyces]
MSTNVVDSPTPAPAPPSPPPSGIRRFADRWPFRRKLNALVGVPLAVVALLLSYLIADQVGQARDAADAAQLVRDSVQVAALVDQVQNEYQQAILLSVRYEAAGSGEKPSTTGYRKAQAAVDAQVEKVREAFGDRLPGTEAQSLREVNGLTSLRENVEAGYLPADNIDPTYTSVAKGLIDGLGLDRNAALAATFTGNMLESLLRADAAHSAFETNVFSATTGDSNALIQFNSAVGAYQLYTYQADRFGRFATEAQADELGGMERDGPQATIAQQYAELQVDPSALQAKGPAQLRRAFTSALGTYPDYRAQAESRLKITTSLTDQIAGRADDASSDAWWRAGWLLAAALLGFVLWLGFSVAVRRSVVRPVTALTGAAQRVAEVAGRELARVADDDAEDAGPPRLSEVPVAVRDEIGELAEAFNHVQGTAAALLERQVLSRRNVAEMFGNVGRRVSNLTARQLALIDAVERGETDPALLDRLYRIDHIAVRLRRNADSLMLLAGIRETVLDAGPTALTNVVRAALGQIEGYQRVVLRADTEVMVEPDIIGDLTLMVAELIENAVAFSPARSPVEVAVRADGDGAHIEIADHGLGMSTERLAEENARLVRRERLDLVPTKVLGLFVVGTLARRWGVTVTLSRTPGGGVTSRIALPSALLLTLSPLSADAPASAGGGRLAGTPSAAPDGGRAVAGSPADAPAVAPAEPRRALPAASRTARSEDPGSAAADEHTGRTPAWAARRAAEGADAGSAEPMPADGDPLVPLPRRVPRRDAEEAAPAERAPEADGPGRLPARPGTSRRVTEEAGPTGRTSMDDTPAERAPEADAAGRAGSAGSGPEPAGDGTRTPLVPRPRTETPLRSERDRPYLTEGAGYGAEPGPAPHRDTDASRAHRDDHADALRADRDETAEAPRDHHAGTPRAYPDDAPRAYRDHTTEVPRAHRDDEVPGGSGSPRRTGPAVPSAPDGEAAAGGVRPLRRRVRGATLRTTVGDAAAQRAAEPLRPADAEAVRDALDEFEAAVARANRDARTDPADGPRTLPSVSPTSSATPRATHDQNHLPEGAEQ